MNEPAWRETLKTMVFNDNYIIFCFLNTRKDELEAQRRNIERTSVAVFGRDCAPDRCGYRRRRNIGEMKT